MAIVKSCVVGKFHQAWWGSKMKYIVAMLAGTFAFAGAATADACDQLKQFSNAVELNAPEGLSDYPVLGAGESECSAGIGLERVGLGGHRMGVSTVDCYWDNTDTRTFTSDDLLDTVFPLLSCPVLTFNKLEKYDEGIEYKFTYADRTQILFGNDDSGMYLNIFRSE
tara:strand:- start:856 stop:1356 length:501 start_codon:yes stop_codon:yes gene_type:complete